MAIAVELGSQKHFPAQLYGSQKVSVVHTQTLSSVHISTIKKIPAIKNIYFRFDMFRPAV
jgi:hypothetical protein